MQTRKVFIGLAAAGALTLWVGASALADSEQPSNATLELQAQALAATTTANIETCAATKLTALVGQTAPSGVNAEAWAGALEAAGNKVDALARSGSNKARALTNAFDESLDEGDEDVAAPTPTDTTGLQTSLSLLQMQTCGAINSVTVHVPTPKVEPKPAPKPKHHDKPKPKPEPRDDDDDSGPAAGPAGDH